jgi:hypothetical protein
MEEQIEDEPIHWFELHRTLMIQAAKFFWHKRIAKAVRGV